jgi:hypothetical protein
VIDSRWLQLAMDDEGRAIDLAPASTRSSDGSELMVAERDAMRRPPGLLPSRP